MRTAVIAAGVHDRARRARLAVEERDESLVRVEAARAVAGEDRDRLQRPQRRVAAAVRRHQPHQARLVGRPHDEAQRVVHLAARERRERLGHHVDALVHRQQPPHLVLVEDAHLRHVEEASRSAVVVRLGVRVQSSRRGRAPGRGASRREFGPHTAPADTLGDRASTQANASVAMSTPRASASAASALERRRRRASSTNRSYGLGTLRHPRALRERLAALVLARQPAAGKRPERHVRDAAFASQSGSTSLFVAAVEQRVGVLHERGRAVAKRLRDAGCVVVREPPGADQTLRRRALRSTRSCRRAACSGRARARDRDRRGRRRAAPRLDLELAADPVGREPDVVRVADRRVEDLRREHEPLGPASLRASGRSTSRCVPPPYASPVSNQWMPFAQARSMIANASSSAMPCPKNAGDEPMPPKFPQPSAMPAKLIRAGSCSSGRSGRPRARGRTSGGSGGPSPRPACPACRSRRRRSCAARP